MFCGVLFKKSRHDCCKIVHEEFLLSCTWHCQVSPRVPVFHRFNVFTFDRKYDYESYLATLLIRKDLKRTGFAIRALNVELAQVVDLTSTPPTAKGRFLFWNSVIEDIYNLKESAAVHGHPVASELKRV